MDAKEKRKRVMARSIKLGHCVCDPGKPCPCPLFKEKGICTCAGERVPPESPSDAVRLTDFVRSAGCASKISQADLHKVLRMLPPVSDPRLLVGTATADDAGVFQLTKDVTIVQTVDVFTPGVDEPYLFGRIAACNSISDVYAMGGKPITALSVIGFPIYSLPHEVMSEILRGGMDVLTEAGTVLLGGHSINDEEIKFGFAVTGLIDKDHMVTNAGARPGDVLILTKPLGTGIVSLAGQINKASGASIKEATESMASLNRVASEVMVRHGASACTDVTGFGILGHLCQMVCESRVTAEIWTDHLPLLPDVMEYAEQGMYSGANERNAEFSSPKTDFIDDVPESVRAILYDAQTSGGLLIAIQEEKAEKAIADMQAEGVTHVSIVGRVNMVSDGHIEVRRAPDHAPNKQAVRYHTKEDRIMTKDTAPPVASSHEECCASGSGTPDQALAMFKDFMGTANQPGQLDIVTKELIAIALGLAINCVPCSRIHIRKAKDMGIGIEEMEEAAALATAFGGCRALMLWSQMKQELSL